MGAFRRPPEAVGPPPDEEIGEGGLRRLRLIGPQPGLNQVPVVQGEGLKIGETGRGCKGHGENILDRL